MRRIRREKKPFPLITAGQTISASDETARYDVADIIYCDFGVLSRRCGGSAPPVKRALKPGGRFVVDAFAPPV